MRPTFQFRLRTLLLVVALAAVACWVVVDRQRLIRERDDALLRASNAEGEVKERLQLYEMSEQTQRQLWARIKDMAERLHPDSNEPKDQP